MRAGVVGQRVHDRPRGGHGLPGLVVDRHRGTVPGDRDDIGEADRTHPEHHGGRRAPNGRGRPTGSAPMPVWSVAASWVLQWSPVHWMPSGRCAREGQRVVLSGIPDRWSTMTLCRGPSRPTGWSRGGRTGAPGFLRRTRARTCAAGWPCCNCWRPRPAPVSACRHRPRPGAAAVDDLRTAHRVGRRRVCRSPARRAPVGARAVGLRDRQRLPARRAAGAHRPAGDCPAQCGDLDHGASGGAARHGDAVPGEGTTQRRPADFGHRGRCAVAGRAHRDRPVDPGVPARRSGPRRVPGPGVVRDADRSRPGHACPRCDATCPRSAAVDGRSRTAGSLRGRRRSPPRSSTTTRGRSPRSASPSGIGALTTPPVADPTIGINGCNGEFADLAEPVRRSARELTAAIGGHFV